MNAIEAEAILRSLSNRYADGINRADFDVVGACWATDGVWTVPAPFSIQRVSRDAIVGRLSERRAVVESVVMTVCTVVATDSSPNEIRGRTTIEETVIEDLDRRFHMFGMYDDVLVLEGGAWRFSSRTMNVLLADGRPSWSPST